MRKPPVGGVAISVDDVDERLYNIIPLNLQASRPQDKVESLRRLKHFHRTATSRQPGEPWPSTREFGLGLECSSDEFLWEGGRA